MHKATVRLVGFRVTSGASSTFKYWLREFPLLAATIALSCSVSQKQQAIDQIG